MHTAVLPSLHCYRLKHAMQSRPKSPGPGRYDVCVHCSMGYEMVLAGGGDEDAADAFVQSLRRERTPAG